MTMDHQQQALITRNDPRWAQVLARDPEADGTFVYAVKTTGVYCRPSCGARPAKPENVVFYPSTADAERDGFRPCRRCKPLQVPLARQYAATITELCRLIENTERPPTLDDLAARAGLSRYHFQRLFKAHTGVTPNAYAAMHRVRRLRLALTSSESVTDAIYAAGYQSSSRFYDKATKILGMTPSDYRAGGANNAIHFAIGECSLGTILVAQSERGVCAISLGEDPEQLIRELQDNFPRADLIGDDAGFEQLIATVVGFVEAPRLGLNLPLDIRGTVFQQRVWQALNSIQPGQTVSYTEIAHRLGMPKAVRAVANACAANVLAVAIPCHRVVRNDGGLSGYRWGVERKRVLLERESNQADCLQLKTG